MKKTRYHSYSTGKLSKGCSLCVKGRKLVLFITGLCSCRCYFCPLSEQKKDKDVVYANEMPIKDIHDIVKEAKLCSATGAGITGGDPLTRLDRTAKAVKLLKEEFGKRFHIHIYLPLKIVTKQNLDKLYRAGIDEVRFHPDIGSKKHWHKLEYAKDFNWDTGIEIPVIPKKEHKIIELLDFAYKKIDFVNLNELEISSTNADAFEKRGFTAKDISYGVKGSEELALRLLKYLEKKGVKAHYCTTKLKDDVQLRKRIMLRAKNVRKEYDIITSEGTLIRGAVYHEKTVPGFGYHNKIENMGTKEKDIIIKELEGIKKEIIRKAGIKDEKVEIDHKKLRILTSRAIAKKVSKAISYKTAIVEEYPTYDQFEVEVEFLN